MADGSALAYGLGFVFAALSGVAIAVQSGINATLGSHGGQAFAAAQSFLVGFACCLIFFGFDIKFRGTPLPTLPALKGAPAWSWLGGPLGAFFIIAIIVFAPRLGAGNFLAVFVCTQLTTAVTLDLIGAVGYVQRTFSWQRWVGVALMGAGVALITLFPGELAAKAPAGAAAPVGRSLTHLYVRGADGTAAGAAAARTAGALAMAAGPGRRPALGV